MNLPLIDYIQIHRLSLYQTDIDRAILPGLNMVIGGNGLGKTTFINGVIYALVGNAAYAGTSRKPSDAILMIPPNYFEGRLEPDDRREASVTVKFHMVTEYVSITRSLADPKLLDFRVIKSGSDGVDVQVAPSSADNLEAQYETYMEQAVGVSKFEDFVFLVARLLVFDESRSTLAWDEEAQNRVLRILFLSASFDAEFTRLSNQVTHFTTVGKHCSEQRKYINKQIDEWLNEKEIVGADKETPDHNDVGRTELKLSALVQQLASLSDRLTNLQSTLTEKLEQVKAYTSTIAELELEVGPVTDQIAHLEKAFYRGIYDDLSPEYLIILEALVNDGECRMCGTKSNHLRELGLVLKRESMCIVCRTSLPQHGPMPSDEERSQLAGEINRLRDRLQDNQNRQLRYREGRSDLNAEVNRCQRAIDDVLRDQRAAEIEMTQLRSLIVQSQAQDGNDKQDDPWLSKQRQRVGVLDDEIRSAYAKRDKFSKDLDALNKQLVRMLNAVNAQLSPLFSEFGSQFLGMECSLVVSQKKKNSKPLAHMFPRFLQKDRQHETQVSESQRFFIDQAFRMALIAWYTAKHGQPTFYIVETPEGSLDLAYEKNVATMFHRFASAGHSILLTSNLNSSSFLQGIYNGFESSVEKRDRTLDLFHLGHWSHVQSSEEIQAAFATVITRLGLQLPADDMDRP
jgi:hypothetical protein